MTANIDSDNVLDPKIPADGIPGLRENWKSDLVSGLLVSLIALPLCLAIAMASGFPAFGGLITAVIGGLIAGPFCGSRLTIKGPAAGLIAISIASVESLGHGNLQLGYQLTLAIIVVAGILQATFAILKLGKFGDFFPSSAVHGMLAAIGIIIISKQVHPMFGVKPNSKEPIELLLEIPNTILNLNPEITFIGLCTLAIALLMPTYMKKITKFLPPPLVGVVIAIGVGVFFDLEHEHHYHIFNHDYTVSDKLLVNVPMNFVEGFTFPNFSEITSTESIEFILMFALIGSLESLLTVKAVDFLDPYQRKSSLNRDLLVVGIANTICGFIGGLPMISEVVRSYANLGNGAKTRWANFFHGLFLLFFLVLAPSIIHKIPISALAAILCVVGFRLASPTHFKHAKEIGNEQLIVFCITIVATLFTDLLIGVATGIITEYLLCIALGASLKQSLFGKITVSENKNGTNVILMPSVCYFGKILGFQKIMETASSKPLILDFSSSKFVDHSFIMLVKNMEKELNKKEKRLQIIGLDKLSPLSSHQYSLRRIQ